MWQQLIKSVGKLHSTFPEVKDAKVSGELVWENQEIRTRNVVPFTILACQDFSDLMHRSRMKLGSVWFHLKMKGADSE